MQRPPRREVSAHARRLMSGLAWLAAASLAAAQPAPAAPGLAVTAGDGVRTVSFLAPTPNFTLTARQSIHPQLQPAFKAEWRGLLKIIRAGSHTFFAAARVFVDEREVTGQPVPLAAGEHALRLVFERPAGAPARLQLQWQSEHFAREPVPWTVLAHRGGGALPSLADPVPGPAVSEAPLQRFYQLVKQFNCAECHELYGPARRAFGANEAPPPLTDAGNKLRASWLEDVLVRNRRVRPWMTLAPEHGGEAARELVDLFARQAGAETGEGEVLPPPKSAQLAEGIKLLGQGVGGLSCITCHDFQGRRSVGDLRGPDMTGMHARIRADWLRRWLRDPGRLQPGTAMPAFFADLPAVQAEEKISLIAATLAAGPNLPLPEGLAAPTQDFKLVAREELIVFRTFIADSSPRSIAVGLPGGLSCVFDTDTCRVRYAWTGGFLDVAPLWTGRGGAPAKVVGEKFFTAVNQFPLRFGSADAPPPRVAFKGYRLVKSVSGAVDAVEFRFDVDGAPVRQTLANARVGRGIEMRFDLGDPAKPAWFVADGARLSSPDGEFKDGKLAVRGTRFTINLEAK